MSIANQDQKASARAAAERHPVGQRFLAELPATETDPNLHLLYEHCLENQIRPESMWRMRRTDLAYLAGHPGKATLEAAAKDKLLANAARAQAELTRRQTVESILISASVGAGVALLTSAISGG